MTPEAPRIRREMEGEALKPCPFCGLALRHYGEAADGRHNGWWSHPSWDIDAVRKNEIVNCPVYGWRVLDHEIDRITAWNRRALADGAAGDGWQDISTAPQTYVPALSPVNHHAPSIIVTDRIFYEVVEWGGPSRPFWVDAHGRKLFFTPTHWRPLPPSPSYQKEGEGMSDLRLLLFVGCLMSGTVSAYQAARAGVPLEMIADGVLSLWMYAAAVRLLWSKPI